MLKKIISIILTVALVTPVISSSVLAEESYICIIEGESVDKSNFTAPGGKIQNNQYLSNGKWLKLYCDVNSGNEWYAEFFVNVKSEGLYDLDMFSTPFASTSWASKVTLSINGGEEMDLRADKFQNSNQETQIAGYHSNALVLKKGSNSLKFIVREKRTNDNNVCFFLDYFGLKKSEFLPHLIKSNAPIGTFEESQPLSFNIEGNGNAYKDTKVLFEVCDYSGKVVEAGSRIFKAGQSQTELNLKKKKRGSYTLMVSCNGTSIVQHFIVVPDKSKRKEVEDSPFAVDALCYGMANDWNWNAAQEYIKMLGLTGIKWVRDRIYLTTFATKSGSDYDFTMPWPEKTGKLLEKEGIDVLMTMDRQPTFLQGMGYGNTVATELVEVYSFWKALAERYQGSVDVWEILNEIDLGGGGSNYDGADVYSSMFKAAALGIIDSKTEKEVFVSPTGAAGVMPELSKTGNRFNQLLYENDIYEFTNINNYHAHLLVSPPYEAYYTPPGVERVKAHLDYQKKTNTKVSNWDGETGISISVENEHADSEEQMVQARYLVTSSIDEIAAGCDKKFFFAGTAFAEGAKVWGMLAPNKQAPGAYASWAAISALTFVMGEANYLGTINNLPDNVEGYAFKDGEDTVVALWSKSKDNKNIELDLGKNSSTYFDMFANESTHISNNGKYTITVNDCPSYIKVDGDIDTGIINLDNPNNHTSLGKEQKSVDDGKRIILLQQYEDKARTNARLDAYQLDDRKNEVTVTAFNFNNYRVEGNIVGTTKNGWSISSENNHVVIEPMSSVDVKFELLTDAFVAENDDIVFKGYFDCGETTKSVAFAKAKKIVDAKPIISDGQKEIILTVENQIDAEKVIDKIVLNINGEKIEQDEDIILESESIKEIAIPCKFGDNDKVMNLEVETIFDDGKISKFDSSFSYATANKKIDLTKEPSYILPDDGEAIGAMYYGKEDLYARVWLGADETNFYMTIIADDNAHEAKNTGSGIWQNDGVQIGICQGLPGAKPNYEIGFSLLNDGTIEQYCWHDNFGNGKAGSNTFKTAKCKITRDENKLQTTYEYIVPWEEIAPINYKDGMMSMSMCFNDYDGAGRTYHEWGSGIAGTKNTAMYRTILFND